MSPFYERSSVSGCGLLTINSLGQLIITFNGEIFNLASVLQNFHDTNVSFEFVTEDIDIIPRGDDG